MGTSRALFALRQSAGWATQVEGIGLQSLVFDMVEQVGGAVVAVVRCEPPQVVTIRPDPYMSGTCTCGASAPLRLCEHVVAVWLRWHCATRELSADAAARYATRAHAMVRVEAALEELAGTYLDQVEAEGDVPAAIGDLDMDLGLARGSVLFALAVALGQLNRHDERAQLLACLIEGTVLDQEWVHSSYLAEAVTLLIRTPVQPESGAVLDGLLRSIDHLLSAPADLDAPSPLEWLVARLDDLISTGAVDSGIVASRLVATFRSAPPSQYPVVAAVAPHLFRSCRQVFAHAYAELAAHQQRAADGADAMEDPPGQHGHRLRAECARFAGDVLSLVRELDAWPCAPFGEFLARMWRSEPWSARVRITDAAARHGHLQWAAEWPEHLPVEFREPCRLRGGEAWFVNLIHRTYPRHPSWADVAIGDAVLAAAEVGRVDTARTMLLDFARRSPLPAHREEFKRIWDAADLGRERDECVREIFGE